jgi:hypothetical protein
VRNCAPCHLPNVDGTVDPNLAVIQAGFRCMLRGSRGGAAHMLVCENVFRKEDGAYPIILDRLWLTKSHVRNYWGEG